MCKEVLFYLSLVLLFPLVVCSQSREINRNVTVKVSNRIDTLIAVQRIINTEANHFSGYRIQIYSDAGNNSKSKAIEVQSVFAKTNPDYSSYLTFSEPYYKVRVGDFRTRIDAEKLLKTIVDIYPAAFIVVDKVVFDPQKTQ